MTTTLHIDAQAFSLDAAQDTHELRAEILAGSRESAYIHFFAHGRGDVSVLMTPGTSARFEVDTATPADTDTGADIGEMGPCFSEEMFDFWPGDLN